VVVVISKNVPRARTPRRLLWAAALTLLVAVAALLTAACGQKPAPPKQTSKLIGQVFPTASARDLTKHVQRIPVDYAGSPILILVTPSKGSQPDADRWIAYLRAHPTVRFREVPVIPSIVARAMQSFINGQMRGGLPKDMWTRVVPLYKDGGRVKTFFGSYGDKVAWAMVLDSHGVIRWFHAAGYSEQAAAESVKAYQDLE
jgi:hypothetical protein